MIMSLMVTLLAMFHVLRVCFEVKMAVVCSHVLSDVKLTVHTAESDSIDEESLCWDDWIESGVFLND